MNKEIESLTKKFKKAIKDEDISEELSTKYKEMLEMTYNTFKDKGYDEDRIRQLLCRIHEEWINLDTEEKKRRLIVDKFLGEIMELSEKIYNMAIEVLFKKRKNLDYNKEEMIKRLKDCFNYVKTYNKEIAKKYVSEAMLDLEFINNPKTEILSLRLGRIIDKRREENEKENTQ